MALSFIYSRSTRKDSSTVRRLLQMSFSSEISHVNGLRPKEKNFLINDSVPLVEKFRTSWPDARRITEISDHEAENKPFIDIPDRTVPDECLKFEMSSSFDHGSSIFYPHLKFHPADFKVAVRVNAKDLSLSKGELKVLREMVGKRYNVGKQELKLQCDRFPNRIENKKFVILTLERLLLESKRIWKLIEIGGIPELPPKPVKEIHWERIPLMKELLSED